MNRISTSLALWLGFSFLSPWAHAQTNTDPNREVNRVGSGPQTGEEMPHGGAPGSHQTPDPLPQFSGNLPSSINQDRTHGVNAPGTMIGPSPENGQPDPRFPGDAGTSGGGNETNTKSSSHSTSQSSNGAAKQTGAGQTGGTTSNLNEGLPSASKDNSGANSTQGSGGTGGGAGGNQYNVGGDAVPGKGAAQSTQNPSDVGRETAGAAPYALGAGVVIIGGFLGAKAWARAKRRR